MVGVVAAGAAFLLGVLAGVGLRGRAARGRYLDRRPSPNRRRTGVRTAISPEELDRANLLIAAIRSDLIQLGGDPPFGVAREERPAFREPLGPEGEPAARVGARGRLWPGLSPAVDAACEPLAVISGR